MAENTENWSISGKIFDARIMNQENERDVGWIVGPQAINVRAADVLCNKGKIFQRETFVMGSFSRAAMTTKF